MCGNSGMGIHIFGEIGVMLYLSIEARYTLTDAKKSEKRNAWSLNNIILPCIER